MPYSLVSASTLGFDLVRLSSGRQVADVLLTGLAADGAALDSLAAHHPGPARTSAERSAAAVRGRKARELAATAVPQLRTGDFGAEPGTGTDGVDRQEALVALLERSTIGDAPTLERLLREDVLGPDHIGMAVSEEHVRDRAADVLADAALAFWAVDALPPVVFRDLVAPFRAATSAAPLTAPDLEADLGPSSAVVHELLAAVRGLDGVGRGRWRVAVDEVRELRRPWATAMHEASWAAHVSGRTRTLAASQLLAVQAFVDGGFTASDGALGAWNALSGCVQGLAMADMLDEQSLAVLLAPWTMLN
ncbi:hypothetical protein GB931_19625 [Modestobacter sp. I12A-02628]|uniref:Uncharacterized protein n=1 Tax=Goekera deserti TaxID=2497753 RepID=A0A7K3WHN1_9ACTN|nr:hypothetical protein [Goekera deserti]MPR00089.1 hypothetical protein [Goekera deserti]NDI49868.1 hypothetical protein [Goekera deserti]NEL55230.1 hypothetical protein [Goekera deserti]